MDLYIPAGFEQDYSSQFWFEEMTFPERVAISCFRKSISTVARGI